METVSPKKNDREDASPFEGLQKGVVLHESRIFSEPQINPRNCCKVLTKILYLIIQGEVFSSDEATSVFFGTTKLFQSQNATLRRLVYLVIKELSRNQDNVFVVINCLNKDMTSTIDLFRANSIRVFAKVIDASMLSTMERFLKQAIVDRNPAVASAALVAGQLLFRISPDVIRRWLNEVQAGLNHKSKMIQYHSLALLHMIKQHDRLAVSKMVTFMVQRPPRSPLAQCLLIRFILQLVRLDPDQSLIEYLMSCLRSKTPMVAFEAARGLCGIPNIAQHHITAGISVLQGFLSATQPSQRFAAVRTLSMIVGQYPLLVVPCSCDLEFLLRDANRNIATLAVTTLLKTGVEPSIDRLMKSVTTFMADINDELRIVLVEAVRALCLKFPQKHVSLMAFLSSVLKEDGGLEYKTTIVRSILLLMDEIADARQSGLDQLCEFIEDCEFPRLSVEVLHILGEKGPSTANPARFIRFIFNRVILETPAVRAAALQTLARFGAACPLLTESCIVLLKRSLRDNDDEVRDRAIYCLQLLEKKDLSGKSDLLQDLSLSWVNMEYSLGLYIQQPGETPFSLDDIVEVEQSEAQPGSIAMEPIGGETHVAGKATPNGFGPSSLEMETANPYVELINAIPEFYSLGELFKSCRPVDLTENEAEYVVNCVKHIFSDHVLLQFNVTNYMPAQILIDLTVDLVVGYDWQEEMAVPAPPLRFEVGGTTWICLARPADVFWCNPMPGTLKFSVRDADADEDEAGYEDEYQLEEIGIVASDFMQTHKGGVSVGDFRQLWEASAGTAYEIVKTFTLGKSDMQEAINDVVAMLNMTLVEPLPVDGSSKKPHSLNLIGTFLGGHKVMARAGLTNSSSGVVLKIAVRSSSQQLSQNILDIIQ